MFRIEEYISPSFDGHGPLPRHRTGYRWERSKNREEHTLREAYMLYMHAHSLSNGSTGLQVDRGYFLIGDKLENWGSDSGLAMTIKEGMELALKMRLKALHEDLRNLKSINDQAANIGERWYPMTTEALEKAVDAKRAR
jgi:hypothetical protein